MTKVGYLNPGQWFSDTAVGSCFVGFSFQPLYSQARGVRSRQPDFHRTVPLYQGLRYGWYVCSIHKQFTHISARSLFHLSIPVLPQSFTITSNFTLDSTAHSVPIYAHSSADSGVHSTRNMNCSSREKIPNLLKLLNFVEIPEVSKSAHW